MGDKGKFIYFRNAADFPIKVYPQTELSSPETMNGAWFQLKPGEMRKVLLVPPGLKKPSHFEAHDAFGRLVFCREYTYDQLEQNHWYVDIQAGSIHCQAVVAP